MKKLLLYTLILFTLLVSCNSKQPVINKTNIEINQTLSPDSTIIKAYLPYKMKIDSQMNEILAESEMEMIKKQPESLLGNFVADLSMEIVQNHTGHQISFCLLNYGGLRTSLPKGAIKRKKIFELMPFENELVIVQLNKSELNNIIAYIQKTGGQPVSGIRLNYLTAPPTVSYQNQEDDYIYVLTTDYLAKGGDNMTFFLNALKTIKTGIKLRDAIIEYCIKQNKSGKILKANIDGRIKL